MHELGRAIDTAAHASGPTDGIVRRKTLLDAGVSRGDVDRLIEIRHLRRVLHGIYLVGGTRLSQRQLHRVALMRAGPAGCLTAQSALELRDVLWVRPGRATGLTTQYRAVGTHRTLIPMQGGGVGSIRLRHLDEPLYFDDVGGLTAAPVGRAISDLVPFGAGSLMGIAWKEAEYRGLLDTEALQAAVGAGRRSGTPELGHLLANRRILTDHSTDVRGKTELPWLNLMLEAGIPEPVLNAPVETPGGRYFADFLWIKYLLALELDSPDHLTPVAAARDRQRDDDFDSVGIHVLRLIDSVALNDPKPHLDRIKAALRRRGWDGN